MFCPFLFSFSCVPGPAHASPQHSSPYIQFDSADLTWYNQHHPPQLIRFIQYQIVVMFLFFLVQFFQSGFYHPFAAFSQLTTWVRRRLYRASSGLWCHLEQCVFTLISSVCTLQSFSELQLAMNIFGPWLGCFGAILFGGGPPCLT